MKPLIDDRELAKILKIPQSTVGYYARTGKLTPVPVGKHRRWEVDSVIAEFKRNGHS